MRPQLVNNAIAIAVLRELQQKRRAPGPARRRKRVPDRRNHAQMGIPVEAERVVARRDPDPARDLEDGLEADAFLADEARALTPAALGTLADAADGLDVLPREAPLVAVNPELVLGVRDGEGGDIGGVVVVISVLDELQ